MFEPLLPATEPSAAAAPDHRLRCRYGSGTITLTRLALAGTDATYFAWVHDVSETGIGLDLLSPLGPGVDLVFELKSNDEGEKIRLHAHVVHATAVGSFYRLGCKFALPLRPSVLAAIVQRIHGAE